MENSLVISTGIPTRSAIEVGVVSFTISKKEVK